MSDKWTKARAARAALDMQNACNLTAILRAMHEIGRAYLDEGTDAANTSPPMKLAMVQAMHLSGMGMAPVNYHALLKECERIAAGQE